MMLFSFPLFSFSFSFPCCLAILFCFSHDDLSPAASCNPLVAQLLRSVFFNSALVETQEQGRKAWSSCQNLGLTADLKPNTSNESLKPQPVSSPFPLPPHKNLYLLNCRQYFHALSRMLAQLLIIKIACPSAASYCSAVVVTVVFLMYIK